MIQFLNANKRILLTLVITLAVASSFWFGSRYPSLNEKAFMGGEIGLESLGFDVVVEFSPEDSLLFRIAATTVNWMETNRQGMTFGIILAACLMTLLSLVKRRSFDSGFANTVLGALVGTPLGVCVNCAAPIARGMHSAGARLETTLAMLLSSPTLNVIVLTMLFALFPWYMAVTKIALTLAFILVGIPLLSRYVFVGEVAATRDARLMKQSENPFMWQAYDEEAPAEGESWLASMLWVAKTFLRHLWFIVKTTVPLMLLAGLLGATVISILPWNSLATLLPTSGMVNILLAMLGLAALGLFLPVPIAFDVVIAAVLFAAGLEPLYVMVLLFTLGIFSVYSFGIVWNAISRRVAVVLSVSMILFGVGSGFAADFGFEAEKRKLKQLAEAAMQNASPRPEPSHKPGGVAGEEMIAALRANALVGDRVALDAPDGIAIERTPWLPANAADGDALFTRHDGRDFGIVDRSSFTAARNIIAKRGIAAGDVHNDGWQDIVVAEDRTVGGLTLYANRGGKRFVAQRIDVPELSSLVVFAVALVDVDNDGWLDIFFTTHMDGNYILGNRGGEFPAENFITLDSEDDTSTTALAFGDPDRDGDLDVAVGNASIWAFGRVFATSKNLLLINKDGRFEKVYLEAEIPGPTLSILQSDINNDGFPDLAIGNDYITPDYFYFGSEESSLDLIYQRDRLIQHTTTSTMSIALADLDNDLTPEMYLAQVAYGVGESFS